MEHIKLMCMAITLFVMVAVSSSAVWARGGHDGGGHGGGGHSGGHGGGHYGGGHSHGHSHMNIGINMGGGYYGGGFWGPGYYGGYGYGNPFFYPPYYAYPPVVVAPSAPPVYIQQENAAPEQSQVNYWYYCRNPDGYYPYVKQCPDGWLQVAPQPAQ